MTRWAWMAMASSAVGWRGPLAVLLWWGVRFLRSRSRAVATSDADVDQLAALVVIGLSASHTLAGAFEAASAEVGGAVELEVRDLLKRARVRGLAHALADTQGPLGSLAGQLARAQVTGAPMLGAVSAFLESRRSAERARLLESARTLPVRLIVPVTLLLLPGFVVLLMGPFVLDQFAGLAIPMTP